jgi:hypothetical protein
MNQRVSQACSHPLNRQVSQLEYQVVSRVVSPQANLPTSRRHNLRYNPLHSRQGAQVLSHRDSLAVNPPASPLDNQLRSHQLNRHRSHLGSLRITLQCSRHPNPPPNRRCSPAVSLRSNRRRNLQDSRVRCPRPNPLPICKPRRTLSVT